MKTLTLAIFASLSISIAAFAQNKTYQATLETQVNKADSNYSLESYRQLVNVCERIISVTNEDWLPYYYGAYAYINMSFIEEDGDTKEAYCEKAQSFLDAAAKKQANPAEVKVLQARLYFALMNVSPMLRAPFYAPKASKLLDEAQKLDPNNPRVYYLKGQSTMYTPSFMGGGKEAARPLLEKAVALYDRAQTKANGSSEPAHPYWGEYDAKRLLNECK